MTHKFKYKFNITKKYKGGAQAAELSTKKINLFFMRHAQGKHNIRKTYDGSIDPELTNNGIEECKIAKDILEGITFQGIYSSPFKRTIQTVDNIVNYKDINLYDNLCEIPTTEPYNQKITRDELEKVFINNLKNNNTYKFMNVTDEFKIEKQEDIHPYIKDFFKIIYNIHKDNDNILIVTHSNWICNFIQMYDKLLYNIYIRTIKLRQQYYDIVTNGAIINYTLNGENSITNGYIDYNVYGITKENVLYIIKKQSEDKKELIGKEVQNKEENVLTRTETIDVLTWNIQWERMSANKTEFKDECMSGEINNCLNNVAEYINIFPNLDIICLQEVENWNNIHTLIKKNNMKYVHTTHTINSGNEVQLVTLYNTTRFKLLAITYDFIHTYKRGRHYHILYFKDNNNNLFIIINLHNGHYRINKYNKINPTSDYTKEKLESKLYTNNVLWNIDNIESPNNDIKIKINELDIDLTTYSNDNSTIISSSKITSKDITNNKDIFKYFEDRQIQKNMIVAGDFNDPLYSFVETPFYPLKNSDVLKELFVSIKNSTIPITCCNDISHKRVSIPGDYILISDNLDYIGKRDPDLKSIIGMIVPKIKNTQQKANKSVNPNTSDHLPVYSKILLRVSTLVLDSVQSEPTLNIVNLYPLPVNESPLPIPAPIQKPINPSSVKPTVTVALPPTSLEDIDKPVSPVILQDNITSGPSSLSTIASSASPTSVKPAPTSVKAEPTSVKAEPTSVKPTIISSAPVDSISKIEKPNYESKVPVKSSIQSFFTKSIKPSINSTTSQNITKKPSLFTRLSGAITKKFLKKKIISEPLNEKIKVKNDEIELKDSINSLLTKLDIPVNTISNNDYYDKLLTNINNKFNLQPEQNSDNAEIKLKQIISKLLNSHHFNIKIDKDSGTFYDELINL